MENLRPKDGNIHTILIEILGNPGKIEKNEKQYADRINEIIETMQNRGYEIVDIKLSMGGIYSSVYETLITYK